MQLQRFGVLGSGTVGETLANGLLRLGHEVLRASREPGKLRAWQQAAGPKAHVGTFADAAQFGSALVLAVKGSAAEDAVRAAGVDALAGKVVIDATNPIADAPPDHGVLPFFTTHQQSLMERLQSLAPKARFVKAFSCVGAGLMVQPKLPGGPPTMFVCGDDAAAKGEVALLLQQFGWQCADMGGRQAARAIEPLCMLWCIPGFTQNRWSHAFKLLQG